jgi:gliding motility-associated lipoprotein GldH
MIVMLAGCDESRVYEKNVDFDQRAWIVQEKPVFDFDIQDTTHAYNLYCNVRNSVSYPYSRIFISYSIKDSVGAELSKQLVSSFLFDQKTGAVYAHRYVTRCVSSWVASGKQSSRKTVTIFYWH